MSYATFGNPNGTYQIWNHVEGIRRPITMSDVTGVAYVKPLFANGDMLGF